MLDKLLAEWFWVDRWMGSSAWELPLEARGLYREMLSQAWWRKARLPADLGMVQRLCNVSTEEWDRTWPRVEKYWRQEGENLVNDTQIAVYQEALAKAQAAQDRASKGGRALARIRRAQARAQASAQAGARAPGQAVA